MVLETLVVGRDTYKTLHFQERSGNTEPSGLYWGENSWRRKSEAMGGMELEREAVPHPPHPPYPLPKPGGLNPELIVIMSPALSSKLPWKSHLALGALVSSTCKEGLR